MGHERIYLKTDKFNNVMEKQQIMKKTKRRKLPNYGRRSGKESASIFTIEGNPGRNVKKQGLQQKKL